jgi:hypothetical protein
MQLLMLKDLLYAIYFTQSNCQLSDIISIITVFILTCINLNNLSKEDCYTVQFATRHIHGLDFYNKTANFINSNYKLLNYSSLNISQLIIQIENTMAKKQEFIQYLVLKMTICKIL